jgi:hypothetical protein
MGWAREHPGPWKPCRSGSQDCRTPEFNGVTSSGLSPVKLRRRIINRDLPKVSYINYRMA